MIQGLYVCKGVDLVEKHSFLHRIVCLFIHNRNVLFSRIFGPLFDYLSFTGNNYTHKDTPSADTENCEDMCLQMITGEIL